MAVEITPRLGLTKYTSGADLHPNRTEFNAMQDQLEGLVAIAEKGTTATRPAAGKVGRIFWATDTQRMYYDDGAAWRDVNTNGGGGAGTAVTVNGTAVEGESARAARADHTHNLPLASATVNGALSATDKKKLDAATAAATAYTIALRNDRGQIMVGTPTHGTHAAHKEYVDGQIETRAKAAHSHSADDVNSGVLNAARLPGATRSVQGALSAADKTKLDTATSATTGGTLVMRAENGQFQLPDPTAETHAVNLRYVNGVGAERMEYKGTLGNVDLNTVLERGIYWVGDSVHATLENNYPIVSGAGTLTLKPFSGGTGYVIQEWIERASTRVFRRSTANKGVNWTPWIESASTAVATQGKSGLLSYDDKKKLDGAVGSNVINTLVKRDSTGTVAFSRVFVDDQNSASAATRKDYVDGQIATRAAKAHTHAGSDITVTNLDAITDLDDVQTQGVYHQHLSASAKFELHYPVTNAGLLEVWAPFNGTFVYQRFHCYRNVNKTWFRARHSNVWSDWKEISTTDHKHNGADITTGLIDPARIANATGTRDGLMPAADRQLLAEANASSTPNTLIKRSENGHFTAPAPTSEVHVVNKAYVDNAVGKKANASHSHGAADLPSASSTAPGLMSAADKKMLDAATYVNTPGTLVQRHPTVGTIHVINGESAGDAVNKGYVDGEVAKRALAAHKHNVADLNPGSLEMTHLRLSSGTDGSETSTGHAFQIGADTATNLAIDNNEIIGRVNGKLDLISMPGGLWGLPAPLTGSTATNKDYVDGLVSTLTSGKANASHNHSGANITSGTINPARIANSTQSLDGLMSSEDKTKLDKASIYTQAGTLALRNSEGNFNVADPTSADNAANKRYVDGAVQPLVDQAVEHFTGDNVIAGVVKPAGTPWKHFFGPVLTSTGAGGATRTIAAATDANGFGGLWFGYNGLPTFKGILGMQMTTKSADSPYLTTIAAVDVNTTRIKYRAWRQDGSGPANVFGNMMIWCDIWGW